MYDDLKLKTGDLIFVRRYSSPHVFLSGEKFSHVAIVFIFQNEPYVLELSHPHIYFMPFNKFLLGAGQSQLFYIRQVQTKITMSNDEILLLLENAKKITYTNKVTRHYLKLSFKTNAQIIAEIDETEQAVCSTFILWVMNQLGLLSEDDLKHKNGTNIIGWLCEHEQYGEMHRLSFFKKTLFFNLSDYAQAATQILKGEL